MFCARGFLPPRMSPACWDTLSSVLALTLTPPHSPKTQMLVFSVWPRHVHMCMHVHACEGLYVCFMHMCCGKWFTHLVAPTEAPQSFFQGPRVLSSAQGLWPLMPFAGATPPTALSLCWARWPSTWKVPITVPAHVVGTGEYGGGCSECQPPT